MSLYVWVPLVAPDMNKLIKNKKTSTVENIFSQLSQKQVLCILAEKVCVILWIKYAVLSSV